MSQDNSNPEEIRTGSALLIAVIGIIAPAVLAAYLVSKGWDANQISSVVGLFTGVIGTMVGAFLGVQVGSNGKKKSEDLAQRALGALSPEKAREILDK